MSFIFGEDQATSKTTSTLPDYVKDASRAAIGKAEDIANQEYQQYQGPRVADMSEAERYGLNAFEGQMGAVRPGGEFAGQFDVAERRRQDAAGNAGAVYDAAQPQFDRASGALGKSMGSANNVYGVAQQGLNRAQQGAGDVSARSGGAMWGQFAPGISGAESTAIDATRSAQPTYEMQAPTLQRAKQTASDVAGRSFPDQAGRYMNPYVSEALQPAMEDLRVQSARLQQQGDADAIQQGGRGAFGGARAGIEAAERQERTQEEMSAMLSEGYRQAYDRAQQAFAEDERRRLAASGRLGGLAGTGADIYGQEVSQRMQGAGLRADITGQGADIYSQASRDKLAAEQARGEMAAQKGQLMAEQAQQQRATGGAFADLGATMADTRATEAETMNQIAGDTADQARAEAQMRRQSASSLMSAGQLPREIEQQSMDVAYQDFEEQRDWDKRGLDAYLRALRGTPYEKTQTQVRTPSTGQQIGQLAGAVTAGVGAYNTFF